MAARGTLAKQEVIKTMEKAFGNNWIGEINKKYYVWAQDDGEQVQIAITLTCPKTNIDTSSATTAEIIEESPTIEMTPEEEQTIEILMKKLGL